MCKEAFSPRFPMKTTNSIAFLGQSRSSSGKVLELKGMMSRFWLTLYTPRQE